MRPTPEIIVVQGDIMRDERYETVKHLIEIDRISTFSQIWQRNYFPITSLAQVLGTNSNRVRRLADHPDQFTFSEVIKTAYYFQVEYNKMLQLFINEITEPCRQQVILDYRAKKLVTTNG